MYKEQKTNELLSLQGKNARGFLQMLNFGLNHKGNYSICNFWTLFPYTKNFQININLYILIRSDGQLPAYVDCCDFQRPVGCFPS